MNDDARLACRILVEDLDLLGTGGIVEPEDHARARLDRAVVVLTVRVGFGLLSRPFQRPPRTYGNSALPCSNATRTSSSGSGRKKAPRPLPAIGATTRAQLLSSRSESHGNFTFTRPRWSGSRLSVTTPTVTPKNRLWESGGPSKLDSAWK